jgi:uncharacterized membrane protein
MAAAMGLNIKKLAAASLFAALIFVVTGFLAVRIPNTTGYLHPGDTVIYAAAYLVGEPLAAASAAVGAVLADIAAGAVVYVPATAVIKGAMALLASALIKRGGARAYVLASLAGGAVMTLGYAVYELALFGAAYALTGLPFNCLQSLVSAALSAAVFGAVRRLKNILE